MLKSVLAKLGLSSLPTREQAKAIDFSILSNEEKIALAKAFEKQNVVSVAETTTVVNNGVVGESYFEPIYLKSGKETFCKLYGGNATKDGKYKAFVGLTILPFFDKVERTLPDVAEIIWKAPVGESYMKATVNRQGEATETVDKSKMTFKIKCDLSKVADSKAFANSLVVDMGLLTMPLADYIRTEIACHISKPVNYILRADNDGNITLVGYNASAKLKPFKA